MKLTKERLKQIIREEANKALAEDFEGESGGDWHSLLVNELRIEANELTDPDNKGHGPMPKEKVEQIVRDHIDTVLEAVRSGYGGLMHELGIDFDDLVAMEASGVSGPPAKPFGRERDTWEG